MALGFDVIRSLWMLIFKLIDTERREWWGARKLLVIMQKNLIKKSE